MVFLLALEIRLPYLRGSARLQEKGVHSKLPGLGFAFLTPDLLARRASHRAPRVGADRALGTGTQ